MMGPLVRVGLRVIFRTSGRECVELLTSQEEHDVATKLRREQAAPPGGGHLGPGSRGLGALDPSTSGGAGRSQTK